jgi:hypothetical protein
MLHGLGGGGAVDNVFIMSLFLIVVVACVGVKQDG